jgi:glucose-1-phosphate cytidylyltransferase
MNIVILAGGFGTRLSEYTDIIPKPMVKIGNTPMLMHIINLYSKYKYNSFFIALGYKSEFVVDFFNKVGKMQRTQDHDKLTFSLTLNKLNITVNLIDTGLETMTGGRIKKLSKYLKNDKFMVTYGDGLADVNINKLEKFHQSHGKLATITAVQPPARFGSLKLDGNKVLQFREKSKLDESWINGGFFVFEPQFLNYIDNDNTFLEREPLEKVSKINELMAFKHEGFWQCMDTKRDRDVLQKLYIDNELDVFLK